MSKVKTKLDQYWHITLGGRLSDENKLKGLAPETIDRLANRKWADYIINEADGSAGKPIKAPNATRTGNPFQHHPGYRGSRHGLHWGAV